MTIFTSGFSLLLLRISKTIARRPGAPVPIEILINKLQGNANIGRKNGRKKKQNTYLKTSLPAREKQTVFDGPSEERKKKISTYVPVKSKLKHHHQFFLKILCNIVVFIVIKSTIETNELIKIRQNWNPRKSNDLLSSQ